ncbi:Receptor-like protein 12 [Hordeum vulgare]|nr:Receptor-like protein 12 [Hordeum vulgare]
MANATHLLSLFILIQLNCVALSSHGHGHGNATASFCRPDQAASLVQLKQSFIFDYSTTTLPSWQTGTDCCLWEGIGCDDGGGRVTVLDLGGCGLYSYSCHAALFNLTSLRYLDLSMNDFGGSRIPASGFQRLSKLTHLNLSYSGFYGQVPIAIGKLKSLISLDLSSRKNIAPDETMHTYGIVDGYNFLVLREPSLETLVANLTNLRELYLDMVDISSSGEEWCSGLGEAVPHLQVLSMADCQLQGPIHSSLSSLRSLTVINLENNGDVSGVVPEFLADFRNLSVLRLSFNDLSGWFPERIFQLKNIRFLDVSNNRLSGDLPEFSNGTSLETLNLYNNDFSGMIKPGSFSNLLSLKELALDGRSISMEPADLSFTKLDSLQNLRLSFLWFSGELGPFFSWISILKNLTSLQLSNCYSCKIMPPIITNLTNLTNLEFIGCRFSGKIPPSIGNLYKLTSLKIIGCSFFGTIPSSVGNLSKLRKLEISYSDLSGSIPTSIGHLNKLMVLVLAGCRFSGLVPSTIVKLTQLVYLDLSMNDLTGDIPTSLFVSPTILRLDLSSNQLYGPIKEFHGLTNLVDLDLSSNNLTGLVQLHSLWKLRKLVSLGLSNNKLSVLDGEGSTSIVHLLPKLTRLRLVSCNMTAVPRFLMHVNNIQTLDLSSNKIQGAIPQWIWEKWDDSLAQLNLSNNIFTLMQLTSYVLSYSRLESLDLSSNRLQGQIPMPNMLTSLNPYRQQILDYSNNRFSSVIPNFTAYLHQTAYLKLSRNNITGYIPNSICDSRKLEVLDLSYNYFSGVIPSCLIEGSNLAILNLRENHFEGTLPYNISEHCNLQTIDLHGNKFQGTLPRSLSNCSDLEVLDIGNNQMVDTFPSWVSRLSNLRVLVLRSNQFYGSLDYPTRDKKFGE